MPETYLTMNYDDRQVQYGLPKTEQTLQQSTGRMSSGVISIRNSWLAVGLAMEHTAMIGTRALSRFGVITKEQASDAVDAIMGIATAFYVARTAVIAYNASVRGGLIGGAGGGGGGFGGGIGGFGGGMGWGGIALGSGAIIGGGALALAASGQPRGSGVNIGGQMLGWGMMGAGAGYFIGGPVGAGIGFGIGALAGGVAAFGQTQGWWQHGGTMQASSPRLIGVGDQPEDVTIQPYGRHGMGRGGGVTYNFYAPITSEMLREFESTNRRLIMMQGGAV